MYVLGKNHVDEEILMSDLLVWNRMNAIRTETKQEKEQKARPIAKTRTKGDSGSGSQPSSLTEKWVAKTTKSEASAKFSAETDESSETDKSKCWICQKVVRVSRDCTMKKKHKCFTCGAEGNFARDCIAQTVVNNVMMVKEAEASPYLKRGKINGVVMTVLLNTESYYTLLKSSIASRCKLKLKKTKKPLYGLGSVSVPSVSAVSKADTPITVYDVEAGPVKVLVVPDNVQRYDMIVGRNWLDLDTVTYKKEEGKLVLCRSKDVIELGEVSVVTVENELDILQVLTTVPRQGRRTLRTEDFKYVITDVSIETQTELLK